MRREDPCDVAVVGGGVIGASVAYHLAGLGARVVLIEREPAPGLGSTGRATGGFRAQFETEIDVRLSLLSREKLLRFRDELDVDPGYEPSGYLFLAQSDGELRRLAAAQAVQRAAGLFESRLVSTGEARAINPFADAAGVHGGAFCPLDGFIRPLEILRGYLEGASRRGVAIRAGEQVVGLRGEPRIEAVITERAEIPCAVVVDAAGAWAAQVAALAGLALPVVPSRRQVGCTAPATSLPSSMPMTIWLGDGFHARVRDGRVLLLLPSPGNPADPFDVSVEDAWVTRVARIARERFPALAAVPVDRGRCWAGLYELSPDGHAIVGPAPGRDNLFFVNGSSGHGVMHAPALGQLTAEWIVHGAPRSLDVSALSPARLAGLPAQPALL